jgi:hypothetical protein
LRRFTDQATLSVLSFIELVKIIVFIRRSETALTCHLYRHLGKLPRAASGVLIPRRVKVAGLHNHYFTYALLLQIECLGLFRLGRAVPTLT